MQCTSLDALAVVLEEFYSRESLAKVKTTAEDLARAEALYSQGNAKQLYFKWQVVIYNKLYLEAIQIMTAHPEFAPDMNCMQIQLCYTDFINYLQEKYNDTDAVELKPEDVQE